MPGFHVVVYSAALPRLDWAGGELPYPGYLYFVSTPAQQARDYRIYVQQSLQRFPVRDAYDFGRVAHLRWPLPAYPLNFQVAYYFRNYAGNVDCFVWRPHFAPTSYELYEVMDIADPAWWYFGTRYVWRGYREEAPVPSRVRRRGLRLFYGLMP